MAKINQDLLFAKQLLTSNELVAVPTETVYGLAANALEADAVTKIFEVKNRPTFDPLIVHVASLIAAQQWVVDFPKPLLKLAEKFWPGPLTLLLPKKSIVPDIVTSGLETVAIRVPEHPLTLELLGMLNFPLAAPSANPFGYISPTQAQHVQDQLGDQISLILEGGNCEVGLESTIVGMEEDSITVYRLGGLSVGEIEKVVGPVQVLSHSSSNPKSPGMLKSHYSPLKPLLIGDLNLLIESHLAQNKSFAVLAFDRFFGNIPVDKQIRLSTSSSLSEAAKNLFAGLRALDSQDVSVILTELLPEEGLGRAINDRLRRAAAEK
jgi:L-threonylcarbamoyladenylate synthase